MKRTAVLLAVALIASGAIPAVAQGAPDRAPELDRTEEVEVDLVLIETLVLDTRGRTVPNLTRDDFRLTVQGKAIDIATFDAVCPAGAAEEPKSIERRQRRDPVAPGLDRRIVLLFDYYHLGRVNRREVLDYAKAIVLRDKSPADEILIAALADGLRIEQRFTRDPQSLVRALERMAYDVTLYARDFEPLTERGFFEDLITMADLLAEHEGPKAVVVFSQKMETMRRSDDKEPWYDEVAQHSAAARTVLYPVWAGGLQVGGPPGGSPSLARLANESGGRFTRGTSDLSLAYARAQRDLACRYTLGYYSEPPGPARACSVHVRLRRHGYEVRSPEMIRLWSAEQRRASRLRAVFVDPELDQNPLLRAHAFLVRPATTRAWEVLATLSIPVERGPNGGGGAVEVTLHRGTVKVGTFRREMSFDPPRDGIGQTPSVTLHGSGNLKPGQYTMTAVLSGPDEQIQTARVEFPVPAIPRDVWIVPSPILAKPTADGLRMQLDRPGKEVPQLDELIGPHASFEPLLVNRIERSEELLSLWQVCFVGAEMPSTGRIQRRIVDPDGQMVHALDELSLDLRSTGKLHCQGGLDRVAGGLLRGGGYRMEVVVEGASAEDLLAKASAPFTVR